MSKSQDTSITEGMRILRGLEEPKEYIPPNTILKLFKHLITDEGDRTRFLYFIAHRHKMRNTDINKIHFVLTGRGGTGKSLLVNTILKYIDGTYMPEVVSTTLDIDDIKKEAQLDRNKDKLVVLFMSNTKLTEITDNTKDFVAQIEMELPSFCKYLRDLPTISHDDYYDSSNWSNTLKEKQ